MALISLLQLGMVDYAAGIALQRRLVGLRKENRVGDVLLLLEHPPVITLGRNAKPANVIASPPELAAGGVEVFECDRGGDVTFHGPGQLVGYPIFDLRGFPSSEPLRKTLGVIEYVRRLEQVLMRTCEDFGIRSGTLAGLTGVWTRPRGGEPAPQDSGGEAKIAAIGVHISRSVTSHGFALNVNTDLEFFRLIIPCGIRSRPVTSMENELHAKVPLDQVVHSIAHNFAALFSSQIIRIESLDALLGDSLGVPLRLPDPLRKIHAPAAGEEDTFWA